MAKKSLVAREKKREFLVQKFTSKRQSLKQDFKNSNSISEKLVIHQKIQQLPRNSSPNRLKNRCKVTGRPKGYYRYFGLSRHLVRELSHSCVLPGVHKSSW